jgi:hypothetical protein
MWCAHPVVVGAAAASTVKLREKSRCLAVERLLYLLMRVLHSLRAFLRARSLSHSFTHTQGVASERALSIKRIREEKARDNLAPTPAFYFNKMYVCVTTF